MNLIVSVASMKNERIIGFLESLAKCRFKFYDTNVLILGTGEEIVLNYLSESIYYLNPIIKQLENKPRSYGEVMKEKLAHVNEIANENSIVAMIDDDYDFNWMWAPVAKKIFSENPQVDYLSLLKAGDVFVQDPINLSGFNFYHWHSCMGGSVIARWKNFKPDMDEFFEKHGTDHMWDQLYWDFLSKKYNRNEHVYTLYDASLVQHCNLSSHYRESTREEAYRHSYGVKFDARMNPFQIFGVPEYNFEKSCCSIEQQLSEEKNDN